MSITIHPITHQDFAAWEPLWQGYLRFYESSLDDAVTRITFERLNNPAEPMGSFLARNGEARAVGMVNWIRHRSCWTEGDYCYLQDLFVDPNQRGGGVGRKLIEAVYDAAKAMGCSRVHWLTHETNTQAMKLYDRIATKSGFIQYRQMF
jgi:GNAT superfamily N-acetyltransferase